MYKNFLCTSIMGHTLSVILRHTLHVIHGCALKGILNHLFNVILGFIPRIHTKQNLNCHTRAWLLARPEDLDSRVTPEYDGDLMVDTRDRLSVTPEYDNKKRMCLKPEYDREQSLIKGLDVVCQCAALLERLKTHTNISSLFCHPRAWLFARPEDLDSRDKPENDGKGVDIFTPEYDHNNLRPQCAPDATGFLSDVYKRGTRARKFLVDGVQCGRSMIEMLGVLAIIGVLSIGGIQGYTKAMDMYHWNKALGQWRLLINLMNIYEPQLHINNSSDVGELSLIPILRATGDLPEEMLVNGDYTVVDALGSSLYIYAHNTGYVGIASFNQKDNYTACRLFFTIGQYYHDMIDVIQIYTNDPNKDPSNGNKQFIGDKYCGASSKNCLKDLGVAQITDLCKNNKVCNGMTSCHYLMHWLSH